ncbi:MAG: TRAP transporter small permease [Elusimicrobiota bacterium]|jgi:TRAP-type C4-dicarboxylate transport system permease small subunit|nr:TRAP transporter small permease [Elusimicrobiota bacterium]
MKKTFLDRLFRGTEYFMAFLLFAMVVFTLANVIMRYFFNYGLVWSDELAVFCFVWLIYVGIIGALRDNRHLFIDSVLSRLPKTAQKTVYFLIQAISLALFAMFTWGSFGLTMLNLENSAAATGIPYAFLYIIGVVTGACGIIICGANIYRLIVKGDSVADLTKVADSQDDIDFTQEEESK